MACKAIGKEKEMLTIFVVEDMEDLRELQERTLKRFDPRETTEDITIVSFSNGKECWDMLQQPNREWEPNLVVTDIEMPEMDGIALITAIREAGMTFPIIATSGRFSADEELEQSATKAGATALLPKPFQPVDLKKLAKQLLEKSADNQAKPAP